MSIPPSPSDIEIQTRRDLAAFYRLVAHFRMTDLIDTHISARIPGTADHFLINRYGVLFEEMRPQDLVKIDIEGHLIAGQDPAKSRVNVAGFTIHSAIHGAREDAHYVIHLHTVAGVGVAAQKEGLLPIGQNACLLQHQVAYHGYEGLALNHEERGRLVEDLGDKPLMLLRNHGTLAVGQTAAAAWIGMFFLERACAQQVAALSGGREHVLFAPDAAQAETKEQGRGIGLVSALAWPGALRMLDRKSPGYDV
jgi:ribulose-5-phosphate 4-epimerase/fuculose-1-phosphate aldolase